MIWTCDDKIGNIRAVMKMNVEENTGRERQKKRWLDAIKNDLRATVCA